MKNHKKSIKTKHIAKVLKKTVRNTVKSVDQTIKGLIKMIKATIIATKSLIAFFAISQIGNIGGQPFWSWYGFNSRVELCATFVSFCANECGYIETGIIPKFASVNSEGIPFFKAYCLWQDGKGEHVGIVEYVADGIVHTIEGNSSDECRQREHRLDSLDVLGYGTPMY